MTRTRASLEQEFEELMIDILEQDHDLSVRRSADALNRRRRDVATLHFQYEYGSGGHEAKAVVTIGGFEGFSITLNVDFRDDDSLQRSAEDAEGLALFLAEHLDRKREETAHMVAQGEFPYGRREDD